MSTDGPDRIAERLAAAERLWDRVKHEVDALKGALLEDKERLAREAEEGGVDGEVMQALHRGAERGAGLQRRAALIAKTLDITTRGIVPARGDKVDEPTSSPAPCGAALDRLRERDRARLNLIHGLLEAQLAQLAAVREELRDIVPIRLGA